jgi:hypothetical protein
LAPAVTTPDAAGGSVRFGVVSCGKRAPGPFENKFGPCILEPGHGDDVPCRFKNLGGPGSVSVSALPVPDEIAAAVADLGSHIVKLERERRNMRKTSALLAFALVANLASALWSVGRLIGWLP